jgi:hypothetical protein
MKVSPLINSFTSGELSPRLASRVDTTKYKTGAKTISNFIVMAHGGVRKRGGSQFVAPVKSGATPVTTDFQYNTEQVYLLEVGYASGAGYIRFFTNGGILTDTSTAITGATQANPCVITANSHGLSNGQWVVITGMTGGMTQLNNRHFLVANVTANTFELSGINSTAYDAFSAGGTVKRIYEVATTYASGEEAELSFTQSADTLYIAHKDHPLRKLERFAATTWTLSAVAFVNGPFRNINTADDNKIAVALTSISRSITAATQATPCVITTSTAHGLLDGACVDIASVGGMTQLNGNTYSVRVLSTTTLALYNELGVPIDSTGFTTYTSGGTATQADSRFGTYPPGSQVTLTATSSTFVSGHVGAKWRLWEPGKVTGIKKPIWSSTGTGAIRNNEMYTNDGKVYGIADPNISYWHFDWHYPTHDRGVVRVEAQVGATRVYHDAVYLHDTSCILEILAYSSATSVTAKVVKSHIPQSVIDNDTSFWEEGAWSTYRGYPSYITGHEQRLWTAGSPGDPQTIWASVAGRFEDFQDGADDDRALIYRIQSDKVEAPVWISPGKILMMGTASGEFSITASGRDEAITPSNVRIVKQTTWGSAPGRVIRIGAASLFLQRDGAPSNRARKVREFSYNFDSDSFIAADMTILSEHLGDSRLLDATFQQDPDPIIWIPRADGSFVGLTYEKEQQVLAWHRHALAGDTATVEHMRALPGSSGDDVWMVVRREIDGVATRYHEILTSDRIGTTDKADSRFLDCHLTYDSTPTETVTGLWHLEGETVQVLADGAVHPNVTVANGRITLNREASVIHIGYVYTAVLETMDIDAGTQAGSSVGAPKRVIDAKPRFFRTLGGKVGREGEMEEIPFRVPSDPMGSSPPLFSGLKKVKFPHGWDNEAIVRIEHDQPLPCNVLSITVPMTATG